MPFTDYLNSLRYDQLFGDGSLPDYSDYSGEGGQGVPMNNIIGPQPMSIPQQQPNMMPQHMGGMGTPPFVPVHQASDALGDVFKQMPQRANPSILNRIFASLSAVGEDPEGVQANLYGPHDREMRDWQTRAGVATTAANMERQNNTLAKSAYDTNESRRITQQRADEYVRRGDTAERTAQANIKSKEAKDQLDKQKFELLEFKTKNPHYTFKTGNDGYIYGLNPQTGKSVKTDLKTGDLNDLQKQQLQLDLIEARGNEARETARAGAELPPKPVVPSTKTTRTKDNTGKETTSTTTTEPTNTNSGQMVQMWGPQGQGPYNIPSNKVEEAKVSHKMTTKKPTAGN